MSNPWAYIAHKDDHWAGVIAADCEKKTLKRFWSEFAGFTIIPVPDRETYLKTINAMKCWHEHPEYKARVIKGVLRETAQSAVQPTEPS